MGPLVSCQLISLSVDSSMSMLQGSDTNRASSSFTPSPRKPPRKMSICRRYEKNLTTETVNTHVASHNYTTKSLTLVVTPIHIYMYTHTHVYHKSP